MAQNSTLRTIRLIAWGAVAAAMLVGGAIVMGSLQTSVQQRAQLPGAARIGGHFELVAHTGAPYSSEKLKGKPHIVFFGFTHCPDICPTTLLEISQHLNALGEKSEELEVLFITVDPARDTPEHLAKYMDSFDPRITGLTGTADQIADVAKAYRAIYEKVPNEDGDDYTMNHTATVYLFDANGRLASTLDLQEDENVQRRKLQRLVGS